MDIDDCATAMCANNGTCIDGVAEYTCLCSPGFRGLTCDVDIDECASTPCYNNATCHDAINSVVLVTLLQARRQPQRGPGKHFRRASRGRKFSNFFVYNGVQSGVLYIFERPPPKRRGALSTSLHFSSTMFAVV